MSEIMCVNYEGKPCYDIIFQDNFDELSVFLQSFSVKDRKICVVSDSRVAGIYRTEVEGKLSGICKKLIFFIFPEGEASKNTDTIGKLYELLIMSQFDRSDLLVALGGGVVGDMTGFVSATYLRGIDFVQIPTTLLSQVDSSVGGKTGVDYLGYKNMVGAFKMPVLVYMNLSVLGTLSGEQFASGMAEAVKSGLIKNADFYYFLRDKHDSVRALDKESILKVVRECCDIKRRVVEVDPQERGERALLNFGHTIGHAIEKLSGFKLFHGHCVSIGMMAAGYLSVIKGYLNRNDLDDIKNTLENYALPTSVSADLGFDAKEILDATANDKKRKGGRIKFILLKNIGEGFIDDSLTNDEILEGIKFIL